jgi:serine/threonine-protein kinase HipA
MSSRRLRGTPSKGCRDWLQTHFQTNTVMRSSTPGLLHRDEPQRFSILVERLCYVGSRGMGALEYQPTTLGPPTSKRAVEVASLVDLANQIFSERARFGGVFSGDDNREAINDILRVGTSAGGARAKAILAWNKETNEFRSGQVDAGEGFEYWIMKFDGITSSTDTEVATPKGYGKIEYAYHLMAVEAGIKMTTCRLHHESTR